jgi:hypothetical protein
LADCTKQIRATSWRNVVKQFVNDENVGRRWGGVISFDSTSVCFVRRSRTGVFSEN